MQNKHIFLVTLLSLSRVHIICQLYIPYFFVIFTLFRVMSPLLFALFIIFSRVTSFLVLHVFTQKFSFPCPSVSDTQSQNQTGPRRTLK